MRLFDSACGDMGGSLTKADDLIMGRRTTQQGGGLDLVFPLLDDACLGCSVKVSSVKSPVNSNPCEWESNFRSSVNSNPACEWESKIKRARAKRMEGRILGQINDSLKTAYFL